MRPWLRPALACSLLLATFACTDDAGGTTEDGTDDGNTEPHTEFMIDFDATVVCNDPVDRVEFATRRIDCWDPELPCTVSSDPPWITGTSAPCSDIAGPMVWKVEVMQTGQYETQLRALAGSSQEGINCFVSGGPDTTKVTNSDLETFASFSLTDAADSECSNP